MKRARACWTTGEENSDGKRRLWQVKTNQSDASLLCLLLRLLSVEIPMAWVERPPIAQRGGGGLGMGPRQIAFEWNKRVQGVFLTGVYKLFKK